MRRDYRGRTQGSEVEIVQGDLADIDSCDAMLAAFTSPDEGIAMEAWYAHSRGMRVVAYTGGTPPHPWTVYVADVICDELARAVQVLSGEQPAEIGVPPDSYPEPSEPPGAEQDLIVPDGLERPRPFLGMMLGLW